MNTNETHEVKRFSLSELLLLAAIIGLAAAMVLPAKADGPAPFTFSPQQPNFYRQDTVAFPCVLTNAGNIVIAAGSANSLKIPVRQGHGLSVFLNMGSGTNATTGAGTLKWDTTPDGTNFTTTQPIQWVITPGNTAITVLAWTNFPATFLDNVRAIQLTGFSNNFTNKWWATNLWYSWSGQ